MRLRASSLRLLRDFLSGEQAFAVLSRAPLWRVLFVEVVVLTVLGSAYYFLRYRPAVCDTVDFCGQLQQEARLAETKLKGQTARHRALSEIRTQALDWIAFSSRRPDAERFFVENRAFPNLGLISIAPFSKQAVGEYYRRAVRVNLMSDYVELVEYIRSIENENPEFNIVELNVSSPESIYPRTNVNILVESYGIQPRVEAIDDGNEG
jgi:hypothetical protein